MLKIKDTYVSTKDVMLIELEVQTEYSLYESVNYYFMIIRYFNGAVARIEVNNREEYESQAEEICNIIRLEEEREKYENNRK